MHRWARSLSRLAIDKCLTAAAEEQPVLAVMENRTSPVCAPEALEPKQRDAHECLVWTPASSN